MILLCFCIIFLAIDATDAVNCLGLAMQGSPSDFLSDIHVGLAVRAIKDIIMGLGVVVMIFIWKTRTWDGEKFSFSPPESQGVAPQTVRGTYGRYCQLTADSEPYPN